MDGIRLWKQERCRFPTICPVSLHNPHKIPSLLVAGGRYWTDGTHCEYGVIPWSESACDLRGGMPRILDGGAKRTPISHNPLRIPPLFSHYPLTIWSQLSDSNRRPTVYKTVALPLS